MVAGSAEALAAVTPLLAERLARQPVRAFAGEDVVEAIVREPAHWLPATTEAVLLLGPPRRSPGRALPGLWLRDRDGAPVPVGWLPAADPVRLRTYADAAARVLARTGPTGPVVVLGQWEDRFVRVGLRTSRWVARHGPDLPVFHWTADRISRTDMVGGLSHGPGVALYFGHGRPRGWAGYHGVRMEHFATPWPEPIGALLALCCENAGRHRTGMSFAERLALAGVCGALLAATTKTRHEHNRLWGPALCEALTRGQGETLASLVAAAEVPAGLRDGGPYRFIGDPAMPLVGAPVAMAAMERVYAPAPDEILIPWSEPTADTVA